MATLQSDTFTEDEVVQLIGDNTSGFTKQEAKRQALAYDFIGGM